MVHALKILPEHFHDITQGNKRFEIRKADRNYKVGDVLALNEYRKYEQKDGGYYTGRFTVARISKIYNYPEYLKDGYVILELVGTDIHDLGVNIGEAHKDD